MTSTSFNVGLNAESRNSSKVLKPPGGGSSDIFGVSNGPAEPQRKNRSHLTSSIFGGEETVTPARNKAGNDSFYNLFGTEPHSRPVSAVKDKFISNIALYQNKDDDIKKTLNYGENEDNIKTELSVHGEVEVEEGDIPKSIGDITESNGDLNKLPKPNETVCDNCEEVNAVASEAPSVNETSSTNSASSTNAPTPSATPAPTANKQRVPPGGFSSGLW